MKLFVFIFFAIVLPFAGATCSSGLSLQAFFEKVATRIQKSIAQLQPFINKLQSEALVSTVDMLQTLTTSDFERLGIPAGMRFAITEVLGEVCCKLVCAHGGHANAQCSECVECLGGWAGPLCHDFKDSKPQDQVRREFDDIQSNARANLQRQRANGALPTGLGFGVDITTGSLKLPVAGLTFSASFNKSWTNSKGKIYQLPTQASFQPSPGGVHTPRIQSQAFITIRDYVNSLLSWGKGRHGLGGFFSSRADVQQMMTDFFQGDFSLAVAQRFHVYQHLSLPSDRTGLDLELYAQRAVDILPPDWNTPDHQNLHRSFINAFGTNYIVESFDGGMVELTAMFETRLITDSHFSTADVEDHASKDLARATGGDGGGQRAEWGGERRLSGLSCVGGSAAELCAPDKLAAWENTIEDAPAPLEFVVADFTELIRDAVTRSCVQRAIGEYIQQQAARWTDVNTCPQCRWGSCAKPAIQCSCANERITGRKCDACVGGWTGEQCNTPICNPPCQHGSCTASHTCQCQAHWTGQACSGCEYGWGGNNCGSPVCPSGCVHGRCSSPNHCDCQARYAGPACDRCIDGWGGNGCLQGQRCFKCGGSGQLCSGGISGCTFKSTCPSCSSGQIATNVQRCFRCGGSGELCSDGISGCTFKHACSLCNGKGYIPNNWVRCSGCGGSGQQCSSGISGCTFKHACSLCGGRGYK